MIYQEPPRDKPSLNLRSDRDAEESIMRDMYASQMVSSDCHVAFVYSTTNHSVFIYRIYSITQHEARVSMAIIAERDIQHSTQYFGALAMLWVTDCSRTQILICLQHSSRVFTSSSQLGHI